VVSSLTGVPAQTSTQQLLPVSWTVTNQATLGAASGSLVACCAQTDHGSLQYNHIWFDRFFLSSDATLSADDTFIGEYPRPDGFTLASGASYTATASIQVPTVAPGSYHLILVTDGFGNRVQESNDDNNVVEVPITVGQADLVVSSLTGVPAQASSQQLLPVSWTVTNQATAGAASGSLVSCCAQTDHGSLQYNHIWFDRFFLSTDATLSADDTFIGEFPRPDNFTLAAGASYTASATIHVPTVAVGSYHLILITDGAGNRVPESNDGNNTSSVPVTVGQADLAVAGVTGMPTQASSQQLVPIAWTVTNQAATGAASGSLVACCAQTDRGSYQYNNLWFDRFFVSTDATLSADDTFLGEYARPDGFRLAAGASYTATATLQMPDLPAGSYYLIFAADAFGDRVPESNEANNTFVVPFSTLGRPDLLAVSLAGAPAQASSQQPLQLTWTVKNQATAGAASGSYVPCCAQTDHGSYQYNQRWFDRVFLSTDATLGAGDTLLGEYARPDQFSLAGGASYSASATIAWPRVPPGSYYLIFTTDGYGNRVLETDETNNTVVVPITGVINSDLVVSNLSAPTGAFGNKQFAAVSWTVTNGGTGTAWHSWQDKIYVSQNPVFDSSAIYLDFVSHTSDLAAGASYTVTKEVTLPDLTTGSYYFLVLSDASDAIAETSETNNGAVSAAPVTVRPTAVVQPAVSLALPSGASQITRSPAFSPDGARLAIADGNRADLWTLDTLASTGSFTGHTNTVASVRFSPLGDQVLSASLDGTLKTWDPVSFSPKAAIAQPNYYNPAVFSSDGTRILAGSNGNAGVANLWDARRSVLLGSLMAGYNVTAVALSPNGAVAVTGGGGGTATLWRMANFTPIAQLTGHTDTVNAVTFSPDGSEFLTASSDGSIRFWASATGASLGTIIQGQHVVDARYSGDGQYIVSCDDYAPGHTTRNTQAYLFTRGGLLIALFQPQGWIDGVNANLGGIRPGFTGVALSPDSTTLATTYQTNSTDPVPGVFLWKTGLPAIPIVPAVPVALASSYPFAIQPGGRYLFEFTVADAQPGLVIHLSGTSNGATYPGTAGTDPVAVQMYLSQSGMPSATGHLDAVDVRSSTLGGNLVAAPTVGGTYRVLVTAASLNGGSINAEISANYSGFVLSSVDGNKVGNAGRATFRVRGIGLPTVIRLVSPSSATLTPVAVSYRDPTRVFATFDLTGAPVGSYDLQATSGSTTLTLARAVTVTTGTGPALSFSLQAPPAIRRNRAYDYAVTYVNTGDSDAAAPFVSVTPVEDGALFYADGAPRTGSGIWLAGADGWPTAVVPAGASGVIRFRASWKTTAGVSVTQLPEDATPFDWAQVLSKLPATSSPPGWSQAPTVLGTTYGQVLGHMRGIAALGTGPVDFTQVVISSLLVSLQGNQL
jgi:WD40 repeat protein